MGADYLEQDVHLTADGNLVAIHDDTLDRTARGPSANCTGLVWTKTLAQLKTCDMGSWFNEANPDLANTKYVGLRIQTLDEIIDRYGTKSRYYIETEVTRGPARHGRCAARHARSSRPHRRRSFTTPGAHPVVQPGQPDSHPPEDPALPLIQLTEGGGPAMTGPAFSALPRVRSRRRPAIERRHGRVRRRRPRGMPRRPPVHRG